MRRGEAEAKESQTAIGVILNHPAASRHPSLERRGVEAANERHESKAKEAAIPLLSKEGCREAAGWFG